MSKEVQTIAGIFNIDRAKKLRKAFKDAKGADFEFEGQPLLNSFAKYLVEFLEGQFNLKG